jgi:cell wall-associated NlpC family hydrolase
VEMTPEPKKGDISADAGKRIVTEAASWKGTPYLLNGPQAAKGVGGDCSGTTQQIYQAADCPYSYQTAHNFAAYAASSGLFRELGAGELKQEGDILYWSNHMAIYSSFALDPDDATTKRTNAKGQNWTQRNDMWTASHPDGPPYSPAEMRFWRPDAPRVFRYQK